uniref:C3H1-type domain-containing protein n=1 Tax=Chenopodium quinoa TaxID=63459 RepID=A0A803M0Q3_CHEQI
MYGRGNYAPQFGQGLQRPMAPYQQQLAGHPSASLFQPGNAAPLQPVHGVPPRGPAYLNAPPAPPSMPHQGPPVSTSNTGQPYMHRPLTGHSGAPALSYLATQQNFVPGSPNPNPPPPPPSSMGHPRAPPPPPYMQLPPPPPQAPPPPTAAGNFSPANFDSAKQQSTESHMSSLGPPPPPLPPSSPPRAPPPPSACSSSSPRKFSTPTNTASGSPTQSGHDPISEQVLVSESSGNITTHSHKSGATPISDEDVSLNQSVLLDLPPPPPKPADENVVRNIEVLCQFIAKNGPEFEEMARKKESGNPEFDFLVGGDPGSEASCSHEYFLWMKKKCSLVNDLHKGQGQRDLSHTYGDGEPSAGPNSLPNVRTSHSPADSDVDMEVCFVPESDGLPSVLSSIACLNLAIVIYVVDDITQSDKEHGVYHSVEDVEPEPVLAGDVYEPQMQENDNDLQCSRGNSLALKSSASVKIKTSAEIKPEKLGSQPTDIHSPFRLIQNYASDDSSDDGKLSRENVKVIADSLHGKSGALSSRYDLEHGNVNSKSSKRPETGLDQSVTTYDRVEGSNPNTAFHGKYVSSLKNAEKEDKKSTPTAVKVDEFGRLVKEGGSESESEDAHHIRRRGRRDRSRNHSRSRSPSDRRRKRSPRRSPRRRKERRSRSRSRSPKRRRSRSRSPYRPGGDFRGEKLRRGKVQTQEYFDFLKGRCYRGSSCRYLHVEVDKNEYSRRYNNKQHLTENVGSVDNPDKHGGSASVKSPHGHNDIKGERMQLDFDKHESRDLASQTCDDERKNAEFIDDAVCPSASDAKKLNTDVNQCAVSMKEDQVLGSSGELIPQLPIYEEHPSSSMPSATEQVIHLSQAEASALANDRPEEESQKTGSSPLGLCVNEPNLVKMPNESTVNASAPDFAHQVSHLPPPPAPQQPTNTPQVPNLLAPSVSFPPQSVNIESGPLYQTPLPQSHYPVPPNPTWNTLPQRHPLHMGGASMPGIHLQFQHGNFPLRNDFPGQMSLRAHPGELPGHSQVSGFSHHTYHLPSNSFPAQPFSGPNLVRDDRYTQFPTQSLVPSSSFVFGVTPQPVSFQGDSSVKNTQSFPGETLAGESSKQSFQNHLLAQQQPPYGQHLTAVESRGSRISTHYNPYASTFDQPLSTRFSSIAFTQERGVVGGIKCDGQSAGDHGSRQIISSSNSSKVGGQTLPTSGGDQYDPLFDSINPFSESIKHAQKQDHAADNSDIMLKLSSRHNVLDVEENNKQKVVGAVAATASLENDEFGETADAEVGAVENGSPSSPNEDADVAEGDIEIDQVKSEGRSKKNKDSRSMKLFKVAVANFVKEVLKPQWRQGNMSKEVFKTIVKKTVDKVSGSMKNHHLPKSQAKIDHYIDSSRRKLTQLVEVHRETEVYVPVSISDLKGPSHGLGKPYLRKIES